MTNPQSPDQATQLADLRAAVLEIAISLGASLPVTPGVRTTLQALADTQVALHDGRGES